MSHSDDAKILETTVAASGDALVVRLQIADVQRPEEEAAGVHMTVTIRVPAYNCPLLVHLQRAALDTAQKILAKLSDELLQSISSDYPSRPRE